ncbi:DotI/IcmL family type IV secretion protein [Legionella clemsonensis]|uniref:Macrophage killing protein with similarity to conjugation protein n=1 Tax=Legionella clemsonensis TaxID=1867846 RepID=A0A222P601_9GAMM|nr:DotI/IcmL family type IV secretion protein [Legionella clemsonensis]ASQ47268.1 Macrophage killing protein with similarity to conjugation protein [Legionella clemsonensis]
MYKTRIYHLLILLVLSTTGFAVPDNTQLAVWANEAIVATYTFDYNNFLPRQKEIAKYFTAAGWTAYSTALNTSKLPEAVKKNYYSVSAVATLPPTIKTINATQWEATMPLLVLYKNPQYQQKQNLLVTIIFIQAPSGQGVRGLAIASLQSKVTQPPCVCQPQNEEETTANDKQQ